MADENVKSIYLPAELHYGFSLNYISFPVF